MVTNVIELAGVAADQLVLLLVLPSQQKEKKIAVSLCAMDCPESTNASDRSTSCMWADQELIVNDTIKKLASTRSPRQNNVGLHA